ncbi:MAG: exonuclease domain-containing protein [Coriobacteriia bacterium]|nr:exonuclease domain-containing protein [Coriobacteriia bacterium]
MLGQTPLRTGTFVTVDIETTGGRPGASEIIEIGAVRIEAGRVTGQFSTLVRANEAVPGAIRELTGITDDLLADAPGVSDAVSDFADFADGAVLIAHNHRFDLGFLDYEAERWLGSPFPRPVLDTLSLARRLMPGLSHYNLRALAAACDASAVPDHRALPDATATAEVFLSMLDDLSAHGVVTAADAAVLCGLARRGDLSRKLTLATHFPDGPGLYLFRDPTGQVVYVGRAKDLRTRVRSHFYGPAESDGPTHAGQAASIDHIPCTSRLDSLLLESRFLDRYDPQFNRNRHQLKSPIYLHVDPSAEYPVFRVTRRRLRSGVLFGPVSNEWAAQTLSAAVSGHFRLRRCTRPASECARRQCAKRREGLCVSADSAGQPADYSERVAEAIAIFNGGGDTFREALHRRRESAAADERYEDAIRFRDAVRALDRTLAALGTAARATRERLVVVVEGDEIGVVAHVIVQGWLHTTLRFSREQIASDGASLPLQRALVRAAQRASRSLAITPRRLRDMIIIEAYRQENAPAAVAVGDDPAAAVRAVESLMRRMMRVPRKRHGAASAE